MLAVKWKPSIKFNGSKFIQPGNNWCAVVSVPKHTLLHVLSYSLALQGRVLARLNIHLGLCQHIDLQEDFFHGREGRIKAGNAQLSFVLFQIVKQSFKP